jgi:acyl transferase domain-containing protein/acyl carrier protein
MPTKHPPVAIVGVSALFPGSPDAERFWRNIVEGKDLFSDVPATHWRLDDYYDPGLFTPDKMYARRGGFLPDIEFNPMDFGIPPNVVPATDTAQLLALLVAKQVLEDAAGGDFSHMDRERMSVILGVASATELVAHMSGRLQIPVWERALRGAGLSEQEVKVFSERLAAGYTPWQENTFPGLLGNVVAGRIANRFDLGGTNCVVDAACAGSLAALQMALNELYLGDSDMVIAGGVDALNDILMFMCFAKVTALSPSGDCRPFSDKADGTMLGEGLAMFALKRLEDAERDGDRIYGVIKGIGTSSDGRAKSIYAPRPEGQAKALRRAYAAAGYGPETVGLVEAHGTGTKAGDAAEFSALCDVFDASGRAERQWCALGSVKSQVGHTKSAAGAGGLFKIVMALHHKIIPPTIKIDSPNPALKIEQTPFYLPTAPKPWIADAGTPRRASVSSFGFGGTNFHVTVEEYTGSGKRAWRHRAWSHELIVLGATSQAALREEATKLASSLVDAADMLVFIARDTQTRYDASAPHRLALVADSVASLRDMLHEAAGKLSGGGTLAAFSSPKGFYYSGMTPASGVALLFPGQGSQYVGMGADLPHLTEVALRPWEAARAALLEADQDLHQIVWPKSAFTDEARAAQTAMLTRTEWAQPGIGAHSLSLLEILDLLKIKPVAVGGHSFGEVSALCAAGVFDRTTALAIARRRGALMAEAASKTAGSMCAVSAPIHEVRSLIESWGLPVVVANHNSPTQVVLSGSTDAIIEAEAKLKAAGLSAKRLNVATAFHSDIVSASTVPFAAALADKPFHPPTIPVYANATAQPYTGDADTMRKTLANQLAQPVRFVEQVEAMWEAGARVFVEVGPDSVLTNLVGKCLEGKAHTAVALDRKGKHGIQALWLGLAQLAAAGVPMDLAALWADYRTTDDPRARKKPLMTLKLNGANYGKPQVDDTPIKRVAPAAAPAQLATAPVAVAPKVPVTAATTPALQAAAAPVQRANGATKHTNGTANGAIAAPTEAAATTTKNVQLVKATAVVPTTPVTRPTLHQAVPMNERLAWVQAFQQLQDRTVAAHTEYQRLMAQSHMAFLQMAETSMQDLSRMVTGAELTAAPSNGVAYQAPAAPIAYTPPAPQPAITAVPAPVAAPGPVATPTHNGWMHAPTQVSAATPAPAPVAAPAPVKVAPPAPVAAPAPVKAAALAAAPASKGVDLVKEMLEVVSEKTGYPVEMLNLSMQLEADLGIDSIKRVEILSAMQERVPSLPDVETGKMAALHTLQEIVDYMQSLLGPVSAAPEAAPAAPATSSAAAPAKNVDLVKEMLEVVSEKTGYPVEMLSLSMELEADLGIDSIKRVEILSAMQERVPSLPDVETGKMAALRTLQEIVDYMQSLLGGSTEAKNGPFDQAGAAPSVARYVVRALTAPASGMGMAGLHGAAKFEIVSAGLGVADALVALLQTHGISATVVAQASADADVVVQLSGLAAVTTREEAAAINRAVFADAQRIAAKMEERGGVFVTVQDTGGTFGLLSQAPGPRAWLGGVAALAKTAAQEWPKAHVKAIDLATNGESAQTLAERIAKEILAGGPELEVGLGSAHGRVTPVAQAAHPNPARRVARLGQGDVVVVSGGARGVTAASIIALARATRAGFVLLGRTALGEEPQAARGLKTDAELKRALLQEATARGVKVTPKELEQQVHRIQADREVRATLSAIEAAGARVRYASVDVRDAEALGALLDDVRRTMGPITGLVHGAGVLADAMLSKKTLDQFDRVFDTKVGGLFALLDATAQDNLKAICFFSSVAARSGNIGQSDYAMANEVLNKVALAEQARRGDACVVRALGWGPWEAGMVTPALKAMFEARGIALIPLDGGAQAFVADMLDGELGGSEIVIGGGVMAGGPQHPISPEGKMVEVLAHASLQPYLHDHRIQGRVVLPVVQVLEWFVRMAEGCRPGQRVQRVFDLKVLRGVPLEGFEQSGDAFFVRCLPVEVQPGQPERFALTLIDARGQARYSATVELGASAPAVSPFAVVSVNGGDMDKAACYADGALFHGPAFQVLERLESSAKGGATARLHGLVTAGWDGDVWATDPAALDGCLQVALLWGLEQTKSQTLPLKVGELVRWRAGALADGLRCVLSAVEANSKRTVCDIRLLDAAGLPVADLRRVEMYAFGG